MAVVFEEAGRWFVEGGATQAEVAAGLRRVAEEVSAMALRLDN